MPPRRGAVEGAAGLCLSRTHYDVEIEHFLMKALDATDGDVAQILKHYGVNRSRLADDLARGLDRLKTRQRAHAGLSPSLVKMLTEAWTIGSLEFGAPQVRTGHCLLALLTNDELARLAKDISREFEKIPAEVLQQGFRRRSPRRRPRQPRKSASQPRRRGAARRARARRRRPARRRTSISSRSTSRRARAPGRSTRCSAATSRSGRSSTSSRAAGRTTRSSSARPASGRRRSSKASRVRIVEGDVPEPLKNVTIRTLDLALLQAGAGVKGEFENRLKGLIEEVKNSPTPIILFIDEAHTMIGAGGAAGQNDAANLLKPALARGELRTHRRDDVGGVQEVLREGPGAGAPLPAREGRGAERGRVPADAARRRAGARDASQRAHPGRRARRGGAAVASLPAPTASCPTRR